MKIKAIFLDRDGVLNEEVTNLVSVDQFKVKSGLIRPLQHLRDIGYKFMIITNQPIIAKGFCTFEEMDLIHAKLLEYLEGHNITIETIYVCPHHPEVGFKNEIKELKIECNCRKPRPGLILKAFNEYNIDLKRSWLIGNEITDIEAGIASGLKSILINNNSSKLPKNDTVFRFPTLKEATYLIENYNYDNN